MSKYTCEECGHVRISSHHLAYVIECSNCEGKAVEDGYIRIKNDELKEIYGKSRKQPSTGDKDGR